MSTKTKRITGIVLMAIPTLILIIGGVSKLLNAEPAEVMAVLNKAGFGEYLVPLGIAELVIAALLIFPKTLKIGFLLASCYFGGAMCVEIGMGQPLVSAIFLVLLWIGMYVRDTTILLPPPAENK
jgi:hypothetical protein